MMRAGPREILLGIVAASVGCQCADEHGERGGRGGTAGHSRDAASHDALEGPEDTGWAHDAGARRRGELCSEAWTSHFATHSPMSMHVADANPPDVSRQTESRDTSAPTLTREAARSRIEHYRSATARVRHASSTRQHPGGLRAIGRSSTRATPMRSIDGTTCGATRIGLGRG